MISILTITIRAEPRFKEMADAIMRASENVMTPFEWVVVDAHLWGDETERRHRLDDAVAGRFSYLHVPPKPTAWQGPTRLTKQNYPDLNNARNTGLCVARGSYVATLDDCCLPCEGWLYHHRAVFESRKRAGICGQQVTIQSDDVVQDGCLVYGTPYTTPDMRGVITRRAPGSWMWGMNTGYFLEDALAVNGYDEIYSGQIGGDDCDFGVRLERSGVQLYYSAELVIYQLLRTHNYAGQPVLAADRMDQNPDWVGGVDKSDWKLNPLSTRRPKELALETGRVAYANETLIERLGFEHRRVWTVGNPFDIADVRAKVQRGEPFPLHRHVGVDWRDGGHLCEMD